MVCSTFCPRRKFGVITCIFGLPRFISNHFLLSPPSHANPADTTVEWAYAFDVHTNAFFPFYLTLYLAQLFLVPIVLKDNWVCLWVGNTLYLAGCAYFFSPSDCLVLNVFDKNAGSPNICMGSTWDLMVTCSALSL